MVRDRLAVAILLLAAALLALPRILAPGHARAGQSQVGSSPTVQILNTPKLGPVLIDNTDADHLGWVLYTFILDSTNTSNCYDDCAQTWPPALVQGPIVPPAGLPGTLGTTTRTDGTTQLTYNGWPLYTYLNDRGPQNPRGDGSLVSGGLWPAAVTGSASPVVTMNQDQQGQYILTNSSGMTLYTHANDPQDQSLCSDACATPWPAATFSGDLIVGAGLSRVIDQITRDDGSNQLTYKHQPLYSFARDKQPGDETGQGVNAFGGQWSVAVMQVLPTPTP